MTGCVSSGELPWPQKVGFLFQKTKVETLRHVTTDEKYLKLRSPKERDLARRIVWNFLEHMPRVERERNIDELGELLQVEFPRDRMLTWDQVETMR